MSTSNIKTPIISRIGFINEWTDAESSLLQAQKLVVERELEKCGLLVVRFNTQKNVAAIIYYKWIQLPFVPQRRRVMKKQKLQVASTKYIFNETRHKANVSLIRHVVKWKRRLNFIERVKHRYAESQNYIIPLDVRNNLLKILSLSEQVFTINLNNVYSLAQIHGIKVIDCIGFSFSTRQLSAWRNFKYYLDTIIVCDFINSNIMSSNALLNVIKLAFIRNSKKGQQRSFLVYVQKLLSSIGKQQSMPLGKSGNKPMESGWVISVSGKFSVTGRTQKFKIQPEKLPLHTLTNVYDYVEGFVNTKAGTFSIKVWRPSL